MAWDTIQRLLWFRNRHHSSHVIAAKADNTESRQDSRDTVVHIDPPAELYAPLDTTGNQIRVLTLRGTELVPLDNAHPNARHVSDHAISCDLEVASLTELRQEQTKPYTALSYVWGPTSNGRSVVVNGVLRKVTLNLYDALWHIVSDTKITLPYRLWVDVLCINQDNRDEKSQQVQLMGEIYRSACDVLVWLGTGAIQAGLGLDEFWKSFKTKGENADLSAADLQAGANFLERSDWFRRSWTFQEIVLASNDHVFIRCGYHVVPWSDFARRAETMTTDIGQVIRDIESARHMMHQSNSAGTGADSQQKNVKLADLMALTAGREARDNRDKIFSLLGMYPNSASLNVRYDMDIGYIYCRVAFRIIEEMGNLSIIWLVDFRSLSIKFRGTMNRDYLYAGLHYGLAAGSGSIFDSQTTGHKSWVPIWDSIHPDYLVQILENDAARTDFDMRHMHPAFVMNVALEDEQLVAEGAILGYYIACAPKVDGGSRHVKDACDHTIQRFPACLMNKQTAFTTKSRKKASNSLLSAKAYKPRWIDAKTAYKELRHHQKELCDCQTTQRTQSRHKAPVRRTSSETRNSHPTQASFGSREESCPRVFWSCVLFGFPEPLVMEPSFDTEHDSLTFSLVARYDANDLLYKAIDALSMGETQIAQEETDSDDDLNADLPESSPPGTAGTGRAAWKSPEEIFKHMGLDVGWMPTTIRLSNRPKSDVEILDH